jgi:hypothetical protein
MTKNSSNLEGGVVLPRLGGHPPESTTQPEPAAEASLKGSDPRSSDRAHKSQVTLYRSRQLVEVRGVHNALVTPTSVTQ